MARRGCAGLARYSVWLGHRKQAAHEQNKSRAHEYRAVGTHLCRAHAGRFAWPQRRLCQDWMGQECQNQG